MILIFGALLAVYVFCRAILPLRLKWGWKALLAVLLAVAAFKFHLLHLFGGPMFFSPVLPCQNMCQLFFCKRIFPSGIFLLFRNTAVIHICLQTSVIVSISGYLLQFINICCSKNLLYLFLKVHIHITTFKKTLWKSLSHRTVCVIEYSME